MINVGILGAGNIARVHARGYARLPNVRVVAVNDIERARADAMAAPFAARAYDDWAAFLAHPDLDMVDVCLPTYLHEQGVVAAAHAGKHVLCEKPVALTLEQVDRMIDAVDRAGVMAMIAQVIRFWPHYLAIREMLDQGKLGSAVMAHAARLGSAPTWSTWYSDPALSGGALFDLHIHDLDWMYYLFGMPRTVYSVGARVASGAWNQVLTSLDYDTSKAAVEASLMMPHSHPFTMIFRLLGTSGYAEYRYGGGQSDPQKLTKLHELTFYPEGEQPQSLDCPEEDPYFAEIAYFVACLEEGRSPAVATLGEARSVLRIVLAARQSLETGRVVSLE